MWYTNIDLSGREEEMWGSITVRETAGPCVALLVRTPYTISLLQTPEGRELPAAVVGRNM